MIIHNVYFWLKADLNEQEMKQFVDGATSLLDIESVASGYLGIPAKTEKRPIIDDSYDYSLIVMFEDVESHDVYQEHSIHDAFRDLAHLWSRIQIYDTETVSGS